MGYLSLRPNEVEISVIRVLGLKGKSRWVQGQFLVTQTPNWHQTCWNQHKKLDHGKTVLLNCEKIFFENRVKNVYVKKFDFFSKVKKYTEIYN
jgi:hypothetical protein